MWYLKEDFRGADAVASLAITFIRPWIVMLALGGLGHRLGRPILYQNYWNVWLAVYVVRLFVAHTPVKAWKAAQTREELK